MSDLIFEVPSKPTVCPNCGRDDIWPIRYGFRRQRDDNDPTPPENAISGGCMIDADSPGWGCIRCGVKFRITG